ncbi:hypothetical protein [Acidipropionibacterium jensenii]|uniref:hypothetical protein n=1 Tax=Acidipropionibacterium jensenii TaxID=1749 RepID=UPI00345652B6
MVARSPAELWPPASSRIPAPDRAITARTGTGRTNPRSLSAGQGSAIAQMAAGVTTAATHQMAVRHDLFDMLNGLPSGVERK